MKKIRFAYILIAMAGFAAVSCDDDKTIPEAELPVTSKTFLSTHFEGVGIHRIEKEATGYSVQLDNRIEIDFNNNGEWLEVDGEDNVAIPTSFILPQIVAYVEDNYSNDAINGIEKKTTGFDVDLVKQDIDLYFDPEGAFISIDR